MGQPAIPHFFLYGEPPRDVSGRFLHLEDMDDRTRPANWNIRPHTHANLNHIFYVAEGGGEMRADGAVLRYTAPCLVIVPAGVVHGFAWNADVQGQVLTVSQSYLQELSIRAREIGQVFERPAALAVTGGGAIGETLRRLRAELAWTAPGHDMAVEACLLALLVETLRLRCYEGDAAMAHRSKDAALVARFRELVELRYRGSLGVEAYAGALGVPTKRLRSACAAAAGSSPLKIILDRRLLEAKRLILYSNMTVAEIGYHLGFDDPAYFTRFFTKSSGASPKGYRDDALRARSEVAE